MDIMVSSMIGRNARTTSVPCNKQIGSRESKYLGIMVVSKIGRVGSKEEPPLIMKTSNENTNIKIYNYINTIMLTIPSCIFYGLIPYLSFPLSPLQPIIFQ